VVLDHQQAIDETFDVVDAVELAEEFEAAPVVAAVAVRQGVVDSDGDLVLVQEIRLVALEPDACLSVQSGTQFPATSAFVS
jgi:hypothetical protein